MSAEEPRTLVLGIGNTLMCDDGVGSHVAARLSSRLAGNPFVTVLDGGTLSFTLLGDVQSASSLIVIDAAQLKAPPGTVRCLRNEEMDQHLRQGGKSVHEVGLADLLDMARLSDRLPEPRALIGIQPENTDWGHQPTLAVAAAMDDAEQLALRLLREWTAERAVAASPRADTAVNHRKPHAIT